MDQKQSTSYQVMQNRQGRAISYSVAENLNSSDDYALPPSFLNEETLAVRQTGVHAQQQRFNKNQLQTRQNQQVVGNNNESNAFNSSGNVRKYNSNVSINHSNALGLNKNVYHEYYNPSSELPLVNKPDDKKILQTTSAFNQYSETKRVPYVSLGNTRFEQRKHSAGNPVNDQYYVPYGDQQNKNQQNRYSISETNTEHNIENNRITNYVLPLDTQRNATVQQYHIYDDTPSIPALKDISEKSLKQQNRNLDARNNSTYDEIPNLMQNGNLQKLVNSATSLAYNRYNPNTRLLTTVNSSSNLLLKTNKASLGSHSKFDTESDEEDAELKLVFLLHKFFYSLDMVF